MSGVFGHRLGRPGVAMTVRPAFVPSSQPLSASRRTACEVAKAASGVVAAAAAEEARGCPLTSSSSEPTCVAHRTSG